MKIVFRTVGILTGILLIFFFLQYSNYAIFPMHNEVVLDCSVKEGITSSELVEISQKNNITTFTISYENTSFFDRKINFKFLNVNPNDRICFGLQKNLLPTTEVYYTEYGSDVMYIQHFWTVQNEGADFKAFIGELEDNFLEYENFNPVKLSILDILNVHNLHFFISVFLLLLFLNFVWLYIHCKKNAVLEFCESKDFNAIRPRLINNIRAMVSSFLLIGGAFGIYVFLRNYTFIFDFFKTFIAFVLILLVTQIFCVHLVLMTVQKVVISSLSGVVKRNCFIALLLVLEIITMCIFIISSQNTYFNIMNITMFRQGASLIGNFSPVYITTSKIPDDPSMERLLSVFDETNMNNVYNYAHPTNSLLGYKEFCNEEARNQMFTDAPTIRMSYNMLDFVPIYESNGAQLRKEDLNQKVTTLLIPDHLKEDAEKILNNFYGGQSFEVRFIQSNQVHFDILDPSRRVLNAKYMLTPVERKIYYTNGEVLFDDNAITVIEQKMADYGFDPGSISLTRLSTDYEMIGDELKLAFVCDGLLWTMDALCFFAMTIFGGFTFYRLCKRKIYK